MSLAADEARLAEKGVLRARALKARRSLSREQLARFSDAIRSRLETVPEYRDSRTIISYSAKPDEVQTRDIVEGALSAGKRVAVVVTDPVGRKLSFSEIRSFDELEAGYLGIPEPRTPNRRPVGLREAGLILVPVVGWDGMCNRLGYGQGYFDRALQGETIAKVGLAFECQHLPLIPATERDVRLDVVITEERTLRRQGFLPS